jgi:hypothetical protein
MEQVADIVAKVGEGQLRPKSRNNRIGTTWVLESTLRCGA